MCCVLVQKQHMAAQNYKNLHERKWFRMSNFEEVSSALCWGEKSTGRYLDFINNNSSFSGLSCPSFSIMQSVSVSGPEGFLALPSVCLSLRSFTLQHNVSTGQEPKHYTEETAASRKTPSEAYVLQLKQRESMMEAKDWGNGLLWDCTKKTDIKSSTKHLDSSVIEV